MERSDFLLLIVFSAKRNLRFTADLRTIRGRIHRRDWRRPWRVRARANARRQNKLSGAGRLEHIHELKRSHLARASDSNQLKSLGSNFPL